MKVKILASQPFLEKLKGGVLNGYVTINPERYCSFKKIFGEEDFGFILAGDLQREIRTGKRAKSYLFDKKLYPFERGKGTECDLFLPSEFSTNNERFPLREEVEEMMDYLEMQKREGCIGNIINSKKGTLFEDKISILELKAQGFKIPLSYHFQNFYEIKKFLEENGEEYIIKPRFGLEGAQLSKISFKNICDFRRLNFSNFIVQEKLETTDEKRLIFFKDELIASRIIVDRSSPWEKGGPNNRISKVHSYNPSTSEIEDSLKIMRFSDTTLGCVDWVETKDGGRYYLELNGVGTGYGRGIKPYNVNKLVAQKLKENFL